MTRPNPQAIPVPVGPISPETLQAVARLAPSDSVTEWVGPGLTELARMDVIRGFVPTARGGLGWSEAEVLRAYLDLAAADVTTTFVLTQYAGAIKRIAGSNNAGAVERFLPDLMTGRRFGTVGISHLTTSSQHLARPAVIAEPDGDDWIVTGASPWVTGAAQADIVVLGAVTPAGEQLMLAVETDAPGVTTDEPFSLVALSASQTGPFRLEGVRVSGAHVLAGPAADLMGTGPATAPGHPGVAPSGGGAGTGGLATSALALGLGRSAVAFLETEASKRPDLAPIAASFAAESRRLAEQMLAMADGRDATAGGTLRSRANDFVLRATQASLTAAKGAGYVASHPTGRWCREALFFLVWSCPRAVTEARLCELATFA